MTEKCIDCDSVATYIVVGMVDAGDFMAANPYCKGHAKRYSTQAPWAPDNDLFSWVTSITPIDDYRGD